jgi:hypothetical protein
MEAEQDKARRRLQELADNLNAMQKNVQDVSTVYVHCRTIHHLKSKKIGAVPQKVIYLHTSTTENLRSSRMLEHLAVNLPGFNPSILRLSESEGGR